MIFLESRLYSRRSPKKITCKFLTDKEIIRKVLNISEGGMLLEKENSDDKHFILNQKEPFILLIDNDFSITITGKIIRKQERSIAVSFINLNKEQKVFLKAICI